jgi:hypothetical protein
VAVEAFLTVVAFFVGDVFFTGAFLAVEVYFFGATAGLAEVRLVLVTAVFVLAAGRAAGAFLVVTGLIGATLALVATVLVAVAFLDTGLAFYNQRRSFSTVEHSSGI